MKNYFLVFVCLLVSHTKANDSYDSDEKSDEIIIKNISDYRLELEKDNKTFLALMSSLIPTKENRTHKKSKKTRKLSRYTNREYPFGFGSKDSRVAERGDDGNIFFGLLSSLVPTFLKGDSEPVKKEKQKPDDVKIPLNFGLGGALPDLEDDEDKFLAVLALLIPRALMGSPGFIDKIENEQDFDDELPFELVKGKTDLADSGNDEDKFLKWFASVIPKAAKGHRASGNRFKTIKRFDKAPFELGVSESDSADSEDYEDYFWF